MTDADKQVDFTVAIQGHVGASIKQRFTCERTRTLTNERLRMDIAEHIVKDQFGNLYVVFSTQLIDGELYTVTDWVGKQPPGFPLTLVKEFKRFPGFNDDLLAYLQEKAFVSFGREALAILKARQAAKLTMISANPSGLELPGVLGPNPLST